MGSWPGGSRRFKRRMHGSYHGDEFKYYAFYPNGAKHVTDPDGRYRWDSILSLETLLMSHPNAVELFPPELAVSEGL